MARITVAGLSANDGDVEVVRDELYAPRVAGQYQAKVTESVLRQTGADSKHPGSDMLQLKVSLVATEEFSERTLYQCFVLPDDSYMDANQQRLRATELKRFCLACGVDSEDDAFESDDLYGCDFVAEVNIEVQKTGTYAGKAQNRLTDYLPL